ncbi:hypothetical protein E2C01_020705 [Portunus trituberculatus]|uniref:Uncharacterized protein n=1 Tax=Portunus trituberculatus TaxID=210409 RepID=A0A5B7E2T7_PORTR|nr:hypothetical protein [Portunus trituberculatus]
MSLSDVVLHDKICDMIRIILTWCVVRECRRQCCHGGGLPGDRGRRRRHGEGCRLAADVGDEHGAGGGRHLMQVNFKNKLEGRGGLSGTYWGVFGVVWIIT